MKALQIKPEPRITSASPLARAAARISILGAGAATAMLTIVLWMQRDFLQISYHVHGLRSAQQEVSKPDSIPRYFTRRGIRWLLQSQRSNQERQESAVVVSLGAQVARHASYFLPESVTFS